jgi:flagellar export protein FliJ
MKSLEILVRLSENSLKELRFKFLSLQNQQQEYEKAYDDLSQAEQYEQENLDSQTSLFFPPYVQAIRSKQKILSQEIDLIQESLNQLREEITAQFISFKKYTTLYEKQEKEAQSLFKRKEQAELDEISHLKKKPTL